MKHDRIESLAGAIALGEATDAERMEYREHIAACAKCLRELGGEHEIERVAASIAAARDTETWRPEVGNVILQRTRTTARNVQYGLGIAGLCLAISLGVHAAAASRFTPLTVAATKPASIDIGTMRIALENRTRTVAAAPQKAAPAPAPQRQLVVLHNVVNMQRQAMPVQAPAVVAPQQVTDVVVHPKEPRHVKRHSNRPVWEEPQDSWRTVATTTTVSQLETAPQTFAHHAESIQFTVPVRHDREASVIGGETAINPQPPMIAYDEGAQGTSVFEVVVDERGVPVRCVITKSSGYLVLDNAVCKAAMAAKYQPKIQDGRAVEGVYHDAFTFRMQENPNIEGLPHSPIKF